ncbi:MULTISPECIES: hypothetical protein [Kitasatospora]|uniref:Uncharacterized protein n=1 Tax=Kitasatospora setae (strain ATCC 33774 / DSM 43861 / JCM 3304 / KCC A-0304 / NBRC 14216 / KM-6054) TaxID=452652 RepID=E4N0V3_KITSK|nr:MULTISPECIES: hypothetical protein [Kitasatospora]BAJ31787.1 hypothetical protein KSE_60190 [Kitasatospora setae KM-6054]
MRRGSASRGGAGRRDGTFAVPRREVAYAGLAARAGAVPAELRLVERE